MLKTNNIQVSYCPGCNSYAVSEWIVSMSLLLFRKFHTVINSVLISDKTGSPDYLSLAGKRVCILGKGNVGSKVGKALEGLDMQVSYFCRGGNLISSVQDHDLIINTLSCNSDTEGILDRNFFQSLKIGSYFITVTSSRVYDYQCMLDLLEEGKLSGVADDCGSILPGDYEDPYYKMLTQHTRVLATPHLAYQSDVTTKVANDMMIDNVEAWIKGNPINLL